MASSTSSPLVAAKVDQMDIWKKEGSVRESEAVKDSTTRFVYNLMNKTQSPKIRDIVITHDLHDPLLKNRVGKIIREVSPEESGIHFLITDEKNKIIRTIYAFVPKKNLWSLHEPIDSKNNSIFHINPLHALPNGGLELLEVSPL